MLFSPVIRLVLMCALIASVSGCKYVARLSPGKSADGIARITARSLAVFLKATQEDAACGFSSESVLNQPTVEGQLGKQGSVSWHVSQCVIDFGEEPISVVTGCDEGQIRAKGKMTVTATRTIRGYLTGNLKNPVIPKDADSVRIEMQIEPEQLVVSSNRDAYALIHYDGTLNFTAIPHLASQQEAGDTQGLCMLPTANVAFEKVQYANSHLRVEGGMVPLDATIQDSSFRMQVGPFGEQENVLEGTLGLWGKQRKLPSDGQGLDPTYKREEFLKSNACIGGAGESPSYTCTPMEHKLLHPVLGLSAQHLGAIVEFLESDVQCGFSQPDVLAKSRMTGSVGEKSSQMDLSLPTNCEVSLNQVLLSTDRQGVARYISGQFKVVRGQKSMRGRRILDEANFAKKLEIYRDFLRRHQQASLSQIMTNRPEPMMPTEVNPVVVEVDVEATNLKVWEVCTSQYSNNPLHCSRQSNFTDKHAATLHLISGRLMGKVTPWLAVNTDKNQPAYGVPSVRTNIARLQNVQLQGAHIQLTAQGNLFDFEVPESFANTQVGSIQGEGNWLIGRAQIGEHYLSLQNGEKPIALDPYYQEEVFHNAFGYGLKLSLESRGGYALQPSASEIPPPVTSEGAPYAYVPVNPPTQLEATQPVVSPVSPESVYVAPVPVDPSYLEPSLPLPSVVEGGVDPAIAQRHAFDRKMGHGTLGMSAMLLGVVAKLVEQNTSCGFTSPSVLSSVQLTGTLGMPHSTATWNISTPCVITLPETQIAVDHQGMAQYAKGTVRVWGSKQLTGRLLANADMLIKQPETHPILPMGKEPVALHLHIQPQEFEVVQKCTSEGDMAHPFHCKLDPVRAEDQKSLLVKKGNIAGQLKPRLAIETDSSQMEFGLCVHPTKIVNVAQLELQDVDALLSAQEMSFMQSGVSAVADMQIGTVNKEGNWLRGYYVSDGVKHQYGDDKSVVLLDPDYQEERYYDGFLRGTSWRVPVQDSECSDKKVIHQVAHGVLGLSGLMLGQVAQLLERDTDCGFSSVPVMERVQITGKLGYDNAKATWVAKQCHIQIATPQIIQTNALGVARYVMGDLEVSATKEMQGRFVMDKAVLLDRIKHLSPTSSAILTGVSRPEPIMPTSMTPIAISLTVDMKNARVFEACTLSGDTASPMHCSKQTRYQQEQPTLHVLSGRLTGSLKPTMAYDEDTTHRSYGVCAVPTEFAEINQVSLVHGDVMLVAQNKAFRMNVNGNSWDLVTGIQGGFGNSLQGNVVVDGMPHEYAAGTKLDPDYDHALFTEGFLHHMKAYVPTDNNACTGKQILAENAARLLVQNLGGLAKYATKPRLKGEGFLSGGRVLLGSTTTKRFKDKIVYRVDNGRMATSALGDIKPVLRLKTSWVASKVSKAIGQSESDGLGNVMWYQGEAQFAGTLEMKGKLWTLFNLVDPTQEDAIELKLTDITPRDFASFEAKGLDKASVEAQIAQLGSQVARLVMHGGKLSAVIRPISTRRKGEKEYRIPTPIAHLTDIQARNMPVTMLADGTQISFMLNHSNFEAHMGVLRGQGNFIKGTLEIDGEPITVNAPMVPNYPAPYDQNQFDMRYGKTDGSVEIVH